MRRISVIGVGAGDPAQMTVAAIDALRAADVVFELERGTDDLTGARAALIERFAGGSAAPRVVRVPEPERDRSSVAYVRAVEAWRQARAVAWEAAINAELADAETGAFLVWGDPSLYDSTLAVLDEVRGRGRVAFVHEVIPGISSLHALTARHRITLSRVAGSVLITTGRRLARDGWPAGAEDIAVMLDGRGAYRHVIDLPVVIHWGAYLGTDDELLCAGRLADVADEIDRLRVEARARIGWLMDTYLLQRI